jgi:hypothetical protein
MTISHLLTALLVCPPRMLLTTGTSIRISQIFEFGSEWKNHPIAAWVAVRYVLGSVQYVLQGLTII